MGFIEYLFIGMIVGIVLLLFIDFDITILYIVIVVLWPIVIIICGIGLILDIKEKIFGRRLI